MGFDKKNLSLDHFIKGLLKSYLPNDVEGRETKLVAYRDWLSHHAKEGYQMGKPLEEDEYEWHKNGLFGTRHLLTGIEAQGETLPKAKAALEAGLNEHLAQWKLSGINDPIAWLNERIVGEVRRAEQAVVKSEPDLSDIEIQRLERLMTHLTEEQDLPEVAGLTREDRLAKYHEWLSRMKQEGYKAELFHDDFVMTKMPQGVRVRHKWTGLSAEGTTPAAAKKELVKMLQEHLLLWEHLPERLMREQQTLKQMKKVMKNLPLMDLSWEKTNE